MWRVEQRVRGCGTGSAGAQAVCISSLTRESIQEEGICSVACLTGEVIVGTNRY